jgi:glycosyltransferase involved in cell wall biosynthesis
VDDGSTDGGFEIARAWTDKVRGRFNCSLVRQANAGPSAARNRGLEMASNCDYTAFLDSDDVWPADFLSRSRAALASNPRAVAATCDRRFVYSDGSPPKTEDCSPIERCPCVWMLENGAGIVSSSLLRRSAAAGRGGFNPALFTGEDAALFMRMSLDGPWLHVPGQPVDLDCGLAQRNGGEGNLSMKHSDRQLRWVKVYDQFFSEDGGRAFLKYPGCRRLMALRWYAAGKETYRNGSPHEAVACFRKTLRFNPIRGRYYRWLVRSWLTSLDMCWKVRQ